MAASVMATGEEQISHPDWMRSSRSILAIARGDGTIQSQWGDASREEVSGELGEQTGWNQNLRYIFGVDGRMWGFVWNILDSALYCIP